jgi:Sigma-70 region 2
MHTPDDFYERFIEPIEDRMIRSVWRITRNAQDAEDAMQTALLVMWKRRDRVAGHAAPPAIKQAEADPSDRGCGARHAGLVKLRYCRPLAGQAKSRAARGWSGNS